MFFPKRALIEELNQILWLTKGHKESSSELEIESKDLYFDSLNLKTNKLYYGERKTRETRLIWHSRVREFKTTKTNRQLPWSVRTKEVTKAQVLPAFKELIIQCREIRSLLKNLYTLQNVLGNTQRTPEEGLSIFTAPAAAGTVTCTWHAGKHCRFVEQGP